MRRETKILIFSIGCLLDLLALLYFTFFYKVDGACNSSLLEETPYYILSNCLAFAASLSRRNLYLGIFSGLSSYFIYALNVEVKEYRKEVQSLWSGSTK